MFWSQSTFIFLFAGYFFTAQASLMNAIVDLCSRGSTVLTPNMTVGLSIAIVCAWAALNLFRVDSIGFEKYYFVFIKIAFYASQTQYPLH